MIKTSIFISLLGKLKKTYYRLAGGLKNTYKNSQTHSLFQGINAKLRTYFQYSFLGRVSEVTIERDITVVLGESLFVNWLVKIYRTWKDKIISYLKISLARKAIIELESKLNFMPVKTSSVIMLIAIAINLLLSILVKKQISLAGWFIRLALLSISFAGLFSSVSLREVTKTSFVLRKLYEKNKGFLE